MIHAIRLAATTVGAAARLTRLVTTDQITEPLRYRIPDPNQRDALATGYPPPAAKHPNTATARLWLHELVHCPWCVGVWVSTAAVVAAHTAGHTRIFRVAADSLTVAHMVGLVAQHDTHQ